MLINLNSYKSSMLSLTSLALPTYVLPLNLDFASVLGLGFQYAFQILEMYFLFGPISEQREWLRTITLMLCASLCCSSVMAAEKDAGEAIGSVVATLPNIQKLKPEQEQVLLSFLGVNDVVALLPKRFGKRLIFQLRQLAPLQ